MLLALLKGAVTMTLVTLYLHDLQMLRERRPSDPLDRVMMAVCAGALAALYAL